MTAKSNLALPLAPAANDGAAVAQRPLTIVSLKVTNIKRVRAVHITPDGSPAVIIGGANGAGKTSVLDAIQMALAGARAIPADPVRHGAKSGSIVANLGDLVVERVIAHDGQTTLTVRDAEGIKQRAPQQILDALCSRIAFDPLAFMAMDPAKQNETLRQLLGLDFTRLDAERERCYSQRTEVSKNGKTARATSEAIVVPPSTPGAPVVVTDLLRQLGEANEQADKCRTHARALAKLREDIDQLQAEQRRIEAALMQKRAAVKGLERETPSPAPDAAAIETQIATAETTNRDIRRREQRDELERKANELDAQAAQLTARIEAIDADKAKQIAAKAFPVPGLALGEDGPTLNGVALEQASAAERLRVSVALGLALNPRLKVLLVRDASLLDDTSLALVTQMAADAGAQVWLERVGAGDPTAVVIADGQVANETEG